MKFWFPSRENRQYFKYKAAIIYVFAAFFFFHIINLSSAEEVLLSKERFIEIAFKNNEPEKKSLLFKDKVKIIAQKIMGHQYRKIRFKYWVNNFRSAWILNRIGKVKPITAGFIIDNCEIAAVYVLVYRESHGWEIKYPLFRDQFKGMRLLKEYKLNKKVDGITGATLSVNSMKKMAELALAMHSLIPGIQCS